jgi:hypothetical protein
MARLKTLIAAAILATVPALSALAQEPAAFQAQYPNRDVLNGGALTPAGRLGLELPGGAAPSAPIGPGASGAYAVPQDRMRSDRLETRRRSRPAPHHQRRP